ncbi:hypothetical protein G6F70_000654 [Rhizopus microsporus]|uniref:Uncharacterized protein n=2 Tax=Rhizopus TaxID=4842 RepID=A0A367KFE9_RHIAZ|nr:hypothetical protein G6F71_000365 [Rhizopus microsporus]RCI00552.1 hypothetical protein CU097_015078 [Rhizopus azygosporus]KAG1204242.1 hypothetical protein G6F70_000654 [Rhizopus microsporus]KAG1215649.1 hypothetical protein G6F69_000827 [Rhizopus microsporus]ORE20477.1 2-nitropropane dioxygenase [Rhizopus microsporus]
MALSWATTSLTRALKIQYPIIQAPCAGHTGVNLVAAVSNAGGLGSLGAGMIAPGQLREMIREIQQKTSRPFSVNLFCRPTPPPSHEELQHHYQGSDDALNAIRVELGLPIPKEYQLRSPPLEEQVQVLLDEGVPIVSYTFGYLPEAIHKKFVNAGVYLIGTATTVGEAIMLAGLDPSSPTRKADAIIAQGIEAGGHRGSFLEGAQLSVRDLTKSIRQAVGSEIPIIAAGGLSNGQDVVDVLHLGADGAALGTLFMLSTDSATPKAHREYMLKAGQNQVEPTRISRALTGRAVRSYPNALMKRLESFDVPGYDIHSAKTKDIAAYAAQKGIPDYMWLFTGAHASEAAKYSEQGTLSASEILGKIVSDVNKHTA